MKTLRLRLTADELAKDPALLKAAAIVRAGGLVAFPTETVYGLGANALDAIAVEKIFAAKQRPHWDPIIVHAENSNAARGLIAEWPQVAERLAQSFWPGPLTMLLPLGISLTDPVQVKVDNGAVERYQVQTCTNTGCVVSVPLKDPLLAAMRTGTLLKISIQAPDKRTLNIDVPLLGFGLAYDKAK